MRSDLFIKVEIEQDPGELPERLAAEICRRILQVYGVRAAELSSVVARSDQQG